MADYQRIVEFLRDIRTAPPEAPTDELRSYAAQYADLCRQANERLRRGSEFLQKRLRSEAIHLAEEAPNLLDLVAALDLPDPELWAEYCRLHEMPVPQAIQMDRAVQLQDAYGIDQPLAALLDQHRLLALARAPVAQRLAIVRQMVAQDPTGNWDADQRELEQARIVELPGLFYTAVKNKDFAALTELYQEMQTQPWLEPLPVDFRQTLTEAYLRMQRAGVHERITALLPELESAYATRDLPRCVRLLKDARQLMTEAGVETISADLSKQIDPITAWIKQEGQAEKKRQEFESARKALAELLATDAPDAELRQAHTTLEALAVEGHVVPPEMEQQYQEVRATRTLTRGQQHRTRMTMILAILAAVVLLGAGVGWLFLRSHGAGDWAKRIHAANEARDLHTAEKLVHDLETRDPQLVGNPDVHLALSETEALKAKASADAQRLAYIVAKLQAATAAAQKMAQNPEATLAALVQAADEAQNAQSLGDDSLNWVDEKQEQSEARGALTSAREQLRIAANKLARQRLDKLARQAANAGTTPTLADLADQVRVLSEITTLDKATRDAATAALATIEQKRQTLAQNRNQAAQYQAIGEEIGSAVGLQRALEDFTKHYPDAAVTGEFKQALGVVPAAKSAEAWREMTGKWTLTEAPLSALVAQQRSGELKAFRAAYPTSPFGACATAYHEYLGHAAEALGEKGGGAWQQSLRDLLDLPLISELAYVETSSGKRYYVMGDYKPKERRINDQVSITFDALNPRDFAKAIAVTIDPPEKLTTEKPVPVPHVALAMNLAEMIKQVDEKNWETFGLTLADRLSKATEADWIVRATFLQVVLRTQTQLTGQFIGDTYERLLRDLARQELDKVAWYDPERPVPDATLKAVRGAFASLPSTAEVADLMVKNKKRVLANLHLKVIGLGVLLRDQGGNGKPVIRTNAPLAAGDTLWALAAGNTGVTTRLVPVATVTRSTPVLDAGALAGLPQGTPVLVLRP